MVETIAAKRPLMYVRDGSQKSLFFFQKQFAWDFIWHKNLETWSSSKDNWNGCRVLLCSEKDCWQRSEKKENDSASVSLYPAYYFSSAASLWIHCPSGKSLAQ